MAIMRGGRSVEAAPDKELLRRHAEGDPDAFSELRRRSIRPVVPMGDDATLDSVAPKNNDPTSAHELSLDVSQALQRIPFEQRAALVLVDMMGYPVDDAAKVLDVPPGTIKSRCARGRARLAPLLGHLRNQGGGSTVESAEEGGGKPA
jgi:RNA polymerase sigma-70 factor (ECF subfamily)